MRESFASAYRLAGGPSLSILVGKTLGMVARTATQTVVVVITLQALGIL